jgi:cobalt-zinc-cadmium efflux system outer membrane protein
MTFQATFSAAAVAVLLGGCASTQPLATSVTPPSLGSGFPRYESTDPPSSIDEPQGEISLKEALSLALLHNPKLAAFSWEIRAREAESLQAGLRPNPELAAELENFGGTGVVSGFQANETTLALSQLIELGGKRSRRLEVANLDRDLAAWDYEGTRIDVLTETTKAFVAVLAAQEQLSQADELIDVADSVLQSVARRVRAGATSPVEESRARVSLETSRIDREGRARELSVARTQLAAHWGGIQPRFTAGRGDLDQLQAVPDLISLSADIQQTPAVARWTTELTRRLAERELSRSIGMPDLDLGAGFRHFTETGDVGIVLGVSLPLPLFDRNQGALNAAEMRIAQAEHARRSVETAVHTALQASHADAAASFDEAAALRDRAIPEAESAFALAEEAYRRGLMRLTDVLDTQRALFELKGRLIDALLRYHAAIAELERFTGAPISNLPRDQRRP